MCLKTYIVQYTHSNGNGWAIINCPSPSFIENILKKQSKMLSVQVVSYSELRYFGEEMGLVYEGCITTIGQSPYDIAVANGFRGSVTEWLDSLKGEQGPQGPTGPQGPQGIQGIQGEVGPKGSDGQDGIGVPSGGLTGQVLKKKSDSNYDTEWGEGGGVGNVESVNGKTGVVVLDANDVGALPNNTPLFSGDYNDLANKPIIPVVPTNVSDFNNDAGYLTQHQDISGKADKSEMSVTDGTGADSDKTTIQLKDGTSATVLKSHQSLSGKQDVIDTQHKLSADLVDDTNSINKFTNATEKQTWNSKQDALDFETTPSSSNKVATMADVPTVPNNLVVFSNDNGDGIVPDDGIRAVTVTSAATMTVNPDVVTVIDGAVGTAAITLQVPQDNLAHVWDILMTTDSTVAITFAMSNSATILSPSGFSIGASKAVEISVIGVGTKYYLRYGEFA